MTPTTSQSQASVAHPGQEQRLRMSYEAYLVWADEDVHAEGRYRPIPVDADGRYRSTVVPSFWFEVAWVLSEEPPNLLQALSQIVGPEKLLTHGMQPGREPRLDEA